VAKTYDGYSLSLDLLEGIVGVMLSLLHHGFPRGIGGEDDDGLLGLALDVNCDDITPSTS
jgi:hypothetical protein